MTFDLTAVVPMRYKLREKPNSKRTDDGFALRAGQSIHITREALDFFKAVDSQGVTTLAFTIAPR